MKDWIKDELATANLGDKRLKERMELMLERMSNSPMASVKSAFKGWAEVMSAYRFFDNEKTSVNKILEPHQDSTLQRIMKFKRVLLVQDTTELDYSRKKKLAGTGPLSTVERQGFFAHNHLVITPERLPLGVWSTEIYARDEAELGKNEKRKQKPIEEKESYRWLVGYKKACDLAELAPGVQVINCADREGDVYEIFEKWHKRTSKGQSAADWLIRSSQDRRLDVKPRKDAAGKKVYLKIRDAVEASKLLGSFSLCVKEKIQTKKVKGKTVRKKRSARTAKMEVRATKVTLLPPERKKTKLPKVEIFVVRAKEKSPPKDDDPIDWVLLTTLKVKDYQGAMEIMDLYAARWEIEVFHRVLKTGCRVEEIQLKKDERTKVAIALYMIVAWRIMYLMKLGRECPKLPCDVVFEEDEWQSIWVVEYGEEALSKKPSLGEFISKVAELGGHLGRKGDGPPGPQSIWQGLLAVRYCTLAWQIYSKKIPPLSERKS